MQAVMSEKAEQYVTCMKVYQKLGLTEEEAINLCRSKHGRPGVSRKMVLVLGLAIGIAIGIVFQRWITIGF